MPIVPTETDPEFEEWRKNQGWYERKFQGEILALSRIDHPGVVGVLDNGLTATGQPFLVMQFIEGHSLRKIISPERLPLERVADLVRQIGNALGAVHDKGIWHRDLKPKNIMVESLPEGERVTLIDFGVASLAEFRMKSHRESTRIAGSLAYMAPEQMMGQPSAASDLYALSVIAYELVTGRKPFTAASPVELFEQQKQMSPIRPQLLQSKLSDEAQQLVLKGLSFDPSERPSSARDFGEQLARALAYLTSSPVLADVTKDLFSSFQKPQTNQRWQTWSWPVAAFLTCAAIIGTVLYLQAISRSDVVGGANPVKAKVPAQGVTVGGTAAPSAVPPIEEVEINSALIGEEDTQFRVSVATAPDNTKCDGGGKFPTEGWLLILHGLLKTFSDEEKKRLEPLASSDLNFIKRWLKVYEPNSRKELLDAGLQREIQKADLPSPYENLKMFILRRSPAKPAIFMWVGHGIIGDSEEARKYRGFYGSNVVDYKFNKPLASWVQNAGKRNEALFIVRHYSPAIDSGLFNDNTVIFSTRYVRELSDCVTNIIE